MHSNMLAYTHNHANRVHEKGESKRRERHSKKIKKEEKEQKSPTTLGKVKGKEREDNSVCFAHAGSKALP